MGGGGADRNAIGGNAGFIIDRFEGGWAVCEQYVKPQPDTRAAEVPHANTQPDTRAAESPRRMPGGSPARADIPRSLIDSRAKEGAVIFYDAPSQSYIYDAEETARRSARIKKLADGLWA